MHLPMKTKNVAIQRLAEVIASQAPTSLTAAATAMHRALTGDDPFDEHAFAAAQEMLADAIADMPGTIAFQLDFLRVLHGEEPELTRHSRRNVSAALRYKISDLKRPLTDLDFASSHPAPPFALAYWGGIQKWSAGTAARAQHEKGYWMCRTNQISAIQDVAKRHPGKPITHALLQDCGLHRLVKMTSAAELEVLAAEAGLKRNLAYLPSARWTVERVIDAYADACRDAGVTLSTTALTAIGGKACSLKFYVTLHFPNFNAFQRAVVARYPDIKPPGQPTAKDGTRLDSWSEVVVHNALRAAFPKVRIEPHVVLPGEQMRSADFVVGSTVWIEVLGIARAAMGDTTSARQRKYAKQWAAKSERYSALGIVPVIFEPDDVNDRGRLSDRIEEVAARLVCVPVPPLQPSGKCIRPKGYWHFESLIAAVKAVAQESGLFPTYEALTLAGYGHAAILLRRPGMRARVAERLNLRDPNRKNIRRRTRRTTKRRHSFRSGSWDRLG